MQKGIMLLLCVAVIIGSVWLIVRDRRQLQLLRLRARKLRSTAMFAELQPMLTRMRRLPIERLRVDKTGVTVRFVYPHGAEIRFRMAEHGYPELTEEKQEALLLLIEETLPRLCRRELYALGRRTIRQINGTREHYHQFTIRNDYKIKLDRAPYYDGTLQIYS